MDIATIVAELKRLLPYDIRVESRRENDESEAVEWDFYGKVTAVEYITTPYEDKTAILFFWEEPEGVVGVKAFIADEDLTRYTPESIKTLVRMLTHLRERRNSGH